MADDQGQQGQPHVRVQTAGVQPSGGAVQQGHQQESQRGYQGPTGRRHSLPSREMQPQGTLESRQDHAEECSVNPSRRVRLQGKA